LLKQIIIVDYQNIKELTYTPSPDTQDTILIYSGKTKESNQKDYLDFNLLNELSKAHKFKVIYQTIPTIKSKPIKEYMDNKILYDVTKMLSDKQFKNHIIRIISKDTGFLFIASVEPRVFVHNSWNFTKSVNTD